MMNVQFLTISSPLPPSRPVWSWLNPKWLLAVQCMMALGLTLHMFTVVVNVMYYVRAFSREKEKKYVRISQGMMWTAAMLISISVTIFGIKADIDRQWLPNPDSNFLSWSFGCAVLSGEDRGNVFGFELI